MIQGKPFRRALLFSIALVLFVVAAASVLIFVHDAVRAETEFGDWADNAWGTLKTSINASASTIVLNTGHGARFPSNGKFWVKLTTQPNDFRVPGERVAIAARSEDTLSVDSGGRGADGTLASSWGAGSTYVLQTFSAADMTRISTAINAMERGDIDLTSPGPIGTASPNAVHATEFAGEGITIAPAGTDSGQFISVRDPFEPSKLVVGVIGKYSTGSNIFFGTHDYPGSPYPTEYRWVLQAGSEDSNGDGGWFSIDQFGRGFQFQNRPLYIPADTASPVEINRTLYVPGLSVGTNGGEVAGVFNIRGAANAEGLFTAKDRLSIYPSTSDGAKFEIFEGVAPGSPTNGSIWTTIAGLFAKSTNGGTVGPLIGAAQVNTILASPPAIGSTAPAAGSFTDMALSGDLSVGGNDIRTPGAMVLTSNNTTGGSITLTPRSGYSISANTNYMRYGDASSHFANFAFYCGTGESGKQRVREIYYGSSGSWEWQNLTDASAWDSNRMTLSSTGNLITVGSITCNGTVATSASSANVFNSPTTINAFTSSTSTTIGATNGAIAVRGKVTPDNLILSAAAPASNTATGTPGEIRYDGEYIYKCVATNTWGRAALSASTSW